MSFLAPLMLFGALAGAIPVILHFFYRARYRPVPWGAMKFLKLSLEQTSRRLRFQELVLLILRVLVLLLLAFALARPASLSLTGKGGRGESVDAILVIDTSYSMAAREGGKTRFQRAKEGALSILEDLPANSTVQIISCSDRAKYLGPKNPSNVDQAKQIIDKLEVSQQATDFFAGLNEAVECFRRCQGGNKEVFLISDMQKLGWERQSSAVRAKCAEIKDQANLYLLRCTDRNIKNVSIIGITPRAGIPHTGTRTAFTVLIHNGGTETVTKLSVTLEVEGKPLEKDAQVVERIDPGEVKAVTLTGKLEQAGWRLLTARVHPDDLDEDNRFDKIVLVRDQVRVLVVDGTPNDREPEKSSSFYLGHALLPVPDNLKPSYHIQPRIVRVQDASGPMLADKDVCILANVSLERGGINPDFVQKLGEWVKDGHGLVVTSGANVNPTTYNRVMGPKPDGVDLLPMPLGPVYKARVDEPLSIDLNSIEGQSFVGKFKEPPLNQIARVETTQALTVNETVADGEKQQPGQVAMRFTGSRPAILTRQVGNGEVIFLTTSFDLSWGILPLHPTATPLLHTMLTHLIQRSASPYNRVAGEAIRFNPDDPYRNYFLVRPNRERVNLGKPKQESPDQFSLTTTDTNLAGVYSLVAEADETGTRFAVTPDLRETENLESLKEDEIDQVIGFRPTHMTLGQSFTGYAEERSKREWTTWLLMAMFVFACAEAGWAWLCGRSW